MSAITDLIDQLAAQRGIDPRLAEAIAFKESGFNPTATGDGGHSLGLFQLNDRGEGAGWSRAALFDPSRNAARALDEVAAVQRTHPGADPGLIAALAQRPADPAGYAAAIDRILAGRQLAFNANPLDPKNDLGQIPNALGQIPGAVAGVPGDIGAGFGAIGSAIAGIPAGIGHGLADAAGAATQNVGVFLQRQFVALAVAAVVLLVLFAGKA